MNNEFDLKGISLEKWVQRIRTVLPCRSVILGWQAILSLAFLMTVSQQGQAASFTWTGNTLVTPASLNNGLNWTGGVAPSAAAPDNFIFNAAGLNGAVLNNNITGQVISSTGLNFSSTASAYTINGNGLTLGTTLDVNFNNSSPNLQTINVPLSMVRDLSVTGVTGVTLGGPISQGSTADRDIRNNLRGGDLTLSGTISLADGSPRIWTFGGTGAGTTLLTGNIVNGGAGAGGISIQPTNRLQTVVMSGANTYTGRTNVIAGTLRLDFSAAAVSSNIINNTANTAPLTVGGTLVVGGKFGATNSQRFNNTTFGNLTYRSGALRVEQNGATAINITLGTVARNSAGVTVDFTLPTSGSITTTSTAIRIGTNNIFSTSAGVAYATVDGATWATNSVTGVFGALAGGSYQTAFTAQTGDTDITASATPAAFITNTLRFNAGSTALTLNSSGPSIVTSGGILVTANGAGSSILSGGGIAGLAVGAGKELVIFNFALSTGGLPSFTVNAPILDNGISALTVSGPGVTRLTGVNTYTGITTVSGGVLDVGSMNGTSNAQLGTGGLVLSAGGILQGNGTFTRTFSGGSAPGTNFVGGADGGFAAKGGNLILNFGGASAELVMSLTNSRLGGNFVFGSINSDSAVIVANPLDLQGSTNGVSRTFTVNPGAGTANDYAELQGVVRDSVNTATPVFNKSGAGRLILSAANTFQGVTTINAGTLQLGNGGTTGSIDSTSSIVNNATLAFNRSDAGLTISAVISGSGAVNQIGAGTTTLSGTNNYSGGTSVTTGGLTFLNTNARPTAGTVTVAAGATLGLGVASSGSFFSSANVDNLLAGTLASVTNSPTSNVGVDTTQGNFTYASSIPGSTTRGLVKLGINTLSLSGNNTSYSGANSVNAGSLSLLNTNAKPAGLVTVAAGATLGLGVGSGAGLFSFTDVENLLVGNYTGNVVNVSLATNSSVGIDTTAGDLIYNTSIPATTRGLTKLGANTLSLGGTNSYTGATTAGGGVLKLDSAGALPGGIGATGGTSNLVFSGGVIGLTADFNRATGSGVSQVRWITDTSGGFAAFGADRIVNFGGASALVTWSNGNGILGAGLILSDSTATHTITIANPIALSNAGSFRAVTVNDGLDPAVDAILAGVVSSLTTANNGTRFVKNGLGTLALTAANTYVSGSSLVGTTISAGILMLGNGGTTGSISALTGTGFNSDVTVSSGATFAFTGAMRSRSQT